MSKAVTKVVQMLNLMVLMFMVAAEDGDEDR